MLDFTLIREQPDRVREALRHRNQDLDLAPLLALDEKRRATIHEADALKSERNSRSKEIGALAKAGGDIAKAKAEMRELGDRITAFDQTLRDLEEDIRALWLNIPNLPHESTPVGLDESANVVLRTEGELPAFDFEPQPHWDLGRDLGILEFERAAKMTGAGYPVLLGGGARLQRALIQFMLDVHVQEHGYQEILPPFLCNTASMTGTGQLPKMAEDMYKVNEEDLYLIPTAEVPITNFYRDSIIEESLPIYMTGYTPCFRREAGAAGRDTRGLIRLHQFDKVEMVKFVEPERSYEELESLLANAEDILKRLGLHYRVLSLCSSDISFAAAKCYDLEIWAAGYKDWLEVSSCSNFEDFQARRAGIRYRKPDGKPGFVHTLNGSGVALPRLMVAILENYQQADGSVRIPDVIQPYMGGQQLIAPA
jgi:seryl-tRNA synthetase